MTGANGRAIFDRRRSGYIRDYGLKDVFIFNVMGFALGLALVTNPSFIGSLAPGASIIGVILIGALVAFVNGLVYGWFGGMMPSTGGDYVFVSRVLGPRLGFLANWGFTCCQIYGLALNVGWIVSVGLASGLAVLAVALVHPPLIEIARAMAEPHWVLCASLLLIFCYFWMAFFKVAISKLVVYTLFLFGLTGVALLLVQLYAIDHALFVSAFDAFMVSYNGTANAYQTAIDIARQNGVTNSASGAAGVVTALPLGFLCFLGFTYSVYVGGEVENPPRAQVLGILGALFLGLAVFLAGMGRYVEVVGSDFHSAIGHPAVIAKLGLPSSAMNFLIGTTTSDPTFNVLMQSGILVWFLLIPYVMIQVCTHNIVAWACDNLVPAAALKRSRTGAPWVALLTTCGLAGFCAVLNYFFGFSLVGAVALAAVTYLLVGVAAVLLPARRPDIFAKAADSARLSFLNASVFQVAGLASAVAFLGILWAAIRTPEISGGSSTAAIVMMASVYVLGLIIYEFGLHRIKAKSRSTGFAIDDLFKEIPVD